MTAHTHTVLLWDGSDKDGPAEARCADPENCTQTRSLELLRELTSLVRDGMESDRGVFFHLVEKGGSYSLKEMEGMNADTERRERKAQSCLARADALFASLDSSQSSAGSPWKDQGSAATSQKGSGAAPDRAGDPPIRRFGGSLSVKELDREISNGGGA